MRELNRNRRILCLVGLILGTHVGCAASETTNSAGATGGRTGTGGTAGTSGGKASTGGSASGGQTSTRPNRTAAADIAPAMQPLRRLA